MCFGSNLAAQNELTVIVPNVKSMKGNMMICLVKLTSVFQQLEMTWEGREIISVASLTSDPVEAAAKLQQSRTIINKIVLQVA